ncbi:hypothetical protein BDK51DRAFT_50626 [Blyttiomyces helicus]|uniref:Uncharacterized protein n=1 Tax=Blyttiomyces helicus TaxID=388810 RepID=A0A4P9WH94_9FUNG|nr:hypothetical protein BDK51DRAFT_50626 [Blyttiomyces helicus]|eukprot:RKO91742.1 hypothetical protein BDK51DRAFT_50626 [Blyttiomyces helicus]
MSIAAREVVASKDRVRIDVGDVAGADGFLCIADVGVFPIGRPSPIGSHHAFLSDGGGRPRFPTKLGLGFGSEARRDQDWPGHGGGYPRTRLLLPLSLGLDSRLLATRDRLPAKDDGLARLHHSTLRMVTQEKGLAAIAVGSRHPNGDGAPPPQLLGVLRRAIEAVAAVDDLVHPAKDSDIGTFAGGKQAMNALAPRRGDGHVSCAAGIADVRSGFGRHLPGPLTADLDDGEGRVPRHYAKLRVEVGLGPKGLLEALDVKAYESAEWHEDRRSHELDELSEDDGSVRLDGLEISPADMEGRFRSIERLLAERGERKADVSNPDAPARSTRQARVPLISINATRDAWRPASNNEPRDLLAHPDTRLTSAPLSPWILGLLASHRKRYERQNGAEASVGTIGWQPLGSAMRISPRPASLMVMSAAPQPIVWSLPFRPPPSTPPATSNSFQAPPIFSLESCGTPGDPLGLRDSGVGGGNPAHRKGSMSKENTMGAQSKQWHEIRGWPAKDDDSARLDHAILRTVAQERGLEAIAFGGRYPNGGRAPTPQLLGVIRRAIEAVAAVDDLVNPAEDGDIVIFAGGKQPMDALAPLCVNGRVSSAAGIADVRGFGRHLPGPLTADLDHTEDRAPRHFMRLDRLAGPSASSILAEGGKSGRKEERRRGDRKT